MPAIDDTFVVMIDVQGRLAQAMHGRDALVDACRRLVRCVRALDLPIVWTEQIPEKLGPTIPELQELLPPDVPIAKHAFSCVGEPAFADVVNGLDRSHVLLAGIETHVCVYQTARDFLQQGKQVDVVADAVSSRTAENRRIGLDRMQRAGTTLTSVEMAVFELMESAQHPAFRDILRIVK